MSVDLATVKRVAQLARIGLDEAQAETMRDELNAVLGFVAQLDEVDVTGIEPMSSVIPMRLASREDRISDGDKATDIVANAPLTQDHFFLVPKVVE